MNNRVIMVGYTDLRIFEIDRAADAAAPSLNLLLLALMGDIPGVQT